MRSKEELQRCLSKNIEKMLINSNISRKQMAEYLNVSQVSLSYWINGKNAPALGCLLQMCEIFGLSIDDMYSDTLVIGEKDVTRATLVANYDSLNLAGQRKLADLAKDLVASGRYEKAPDSVMARFTKEADQSDSE